MTDVEPILRAAWSHCVSADWTGWDPFDGLMAESPLVRPLLGSRTGRLVLTQAMKRSPVNLRPLLGVPKLRNPKALALGLEAACALAAVPGWQDEARAEGRRLVESLLAASRPTAHGAGWGYPFDWQGRAFYAPRETPTVVCTAFVVRALDRARDTLCDGTGRDAIDASLARAAAFVLQDLNRTPGPGGFCFSYSPRDRSEVVNATLLGAEILCRVAARARRLELFEIARETVGWSLARQDERGGWSYGTAGHHGWEDSFHTGFCLLSLRAIAECAVTAGADPLFDPAALGRALTHYSTTFFDPDGFPRYYAGQRWPADGHTAAVALTVAARYRASDMVRSLGDKVLDWSIRHLWDERRRRFAYQVTRWGRNTIPYLRWTQAWMLHGLAEFFSNRETAARQEVGRSGRSLLD